MPFVYTAPKEREIELGEGDAQITLVVREPNITEIIPVGTVVAEWSGSQADTSDEAEPDSETASWEILGKLPPAPVIDAVIEFFTDIAIRWRGVVDEQGKGIPYRPKRLEKILRSNLLLTVQAITAFVDLLKDMSISGETEKN